MSAGQHLTFFTAQGDNFRPSLVPAPYTRAHDPGIIGRRGRYKGVPVPYGTARFDVPPEETAKIAYLHRIVVPLLAAWRAAGADVFRLNLGYEYESQCALGFSPAEMQMIAKMDCDFLIDCWPEEETTTSSELAVSGGPASS